MEYRLRPLHLSATAAIACAIVAAPAAAYAENSGDEPFRGVDDGFAVTTTDGGCGYGEFVDYGEGKPGHGNNDDYIRIADDCPDGWSVRAAVWLDDESQGWYTNNSGWGTEDIWDPFPNVKPGQTVELEICLTDASGILKECGEQGDVSADG